MMTDTKPLAHTKLTLSTEARSQMVELLNQLLADYANLISMTLEAHWNVRGSQFFTLHKLFEQLYEDLNGELDTLAERISILGGFAKGSLRRLAEASSLEELPEHPEGDYAYLDLLIDRYGEVARAFSSGIRHADEAGDENTTDLLTGVSRLLDKSLWFLEAHRR